MGDPESTLTSRRLKLNLTVGLYGLMAAFSVVWGVYRDRPNIWFHPDPLYDLPWTLTLPLGLLAGISLGLGISVLSVRLARRAAWARRLMDDFRSLLGGFSTREILLIASMSAVAEELFFRGILMPGLGHVLGSRWLGLALSSLVFGALHVPSGLRMVPWTLQAIAMGLLLGFLFLWTGDLTICVVTHFVINHRNLGIVQTWGDGEAGG
jgi:membrane protease YdiL (CAAX protease family)